MIDVLALLATALLFGGMVSFSFLFAPLVFSRLKAETAARLIRSIFPWYYLAILLLGAAAAALLSLEYPAGALGLAAVAATALLARQVLMPAINRARDRQLAGDEAAGRQFACLHGGSVALNLVQIGILVAVLWALAL